MRSKQLLFTFIILSTLAACSSSNHKFTIIGNITGLPVQTVILTQLNANDIITIVDSEKSSTDGHFELSGISPEPGLYRLQFGQNKYILVSVDKGNMKITADWKALDKYTVAGSEASQQLQNFIAVINGHLRDFNTMCVVMDTLKAKGQDSLLAIARKNFQDMNQNFTMLVERYADSTPYEPNTVFAARMLNPGTEGPYLEAFTQSLSHRFPNTKMTRDFSEFYTKLSTKQRSQVKIIAPLQPGAMAPEVSLPSLDGKVISLSSFKGKYVLLDFWASWCGPCRGENPNVVRAYQKFKDKNFTILSVSLDNNKDAWARGVKDDGLTWAQVSDLKGWSSPTAAAYSVQSIPSNFLIGLSGKIIAQNLRGDDLEEQLSKTLNTPNPSR